MSTKDSLAEVAELRSAVSSLETRVKRLEDLLDDNNYDLFEAWFKRFLDDKCNGGW